MAKHSDETYGVQTMLAGALRRLRPGQANQRPALFLLEIAAALISVLAAHDAIAGGPTTSFELLSAFALWAMALAVACGLGLRER